MKDVQYFFRMTVKVEVVLHSKMTTTKHKPPTSVWQRAAGLIRQKMGKCASINVTTTLMVTHFTSLCIMEFLINLED